MVLRGFSLKVLLKDIDDVVGFDALLSLVSEGLYRFGVLGLFGFSFDPFLNNVFVSEVDVFCPAALCMGLRF